MEGNKMSLAFERVLSPKAPKTQPAIEERTLEVSVVYTSPKATSQAIQSAAAMAQDLGGRLMLVVPQVVPYPLPLAQPQVPVDFMADQLRQIVACSRVPVTVHLYLCRDRIQTLMKVLSPHTLVVLSGPRRWWPTREERLAKLLRREGREVIFTETERSHA
jgi:hypothetical protein